MACCTGATRCAECEDQRAQLEALQGALESERRERARLGFLDQLTDVVLGGTDHRQLLQAAAEASVPTLADWCTFHYVPAPGEPALLAVAAGDRDKAPWVAQLSECLLLRPVGEPAVSDVMRKARSQLVDPVDAEVMAATLAHWVVDLDGVLDSLSHLGVASVLSVPLRTSRGARGAMWLVNASSDRAFGPEDVELAELAAARISEGLDKVWLMQQHRRISATLQRALLPPKLPQVDGIDLAVRYWPAGEAVEAGGDFYDVFESAPGTWSLLIGDVCGTGPDAAALTGITRHTVRAAARHGQAHEAVLEWLNEAMLLSNRDLFCTALYCTLERGGSVWRMETCAAGHPLPIVARPGVPATVIGRPGSLLGVFPEISVHVESVELAEGDLVVLSTDGVTDLPPPAGRTSDDLARLVSDLPSTLSAGQVADAIGRWVRERLPSGDLGDDVALVVFRIGRRPD